MQPRVTGTLFKIKKFALHDGPGIRTTVFLKGCPLRCRWCHNPEGQLPDPQPMQRRVENEDGSTGLVTDTAGWNTDSYSLLAELEKDRIFWDQSGGGVTLSGGEPLSQPDFTRALLAGCRHLGIHTTLDTSGYAPWETLQGVMGEVDLFLYDLKGGDRENHRRNTGVSNALILDNLARLAAAGAAIRLRLPVVPGLNDSPAEIRELLSAIAGLPGIQGVDLLPYHPIAAVKYQRLSMPDPMKGDLLPANDALDRIPALFTEKGYQVTTGG